MLRFVYPILGSAQLRFAGDIEVEKEQRADDRHTDTRHTAAPPHAVFTRKTYSGTAQKAGNETLAMTRAASVSKAATPYSK
jgi:hypothetical protein